MLRSGVAPASTAFNRALALWAASKLKTAGIAAHRSPFCSALTKDEMRKTYPLDCAYLWQVAERPGWAVPELAPGPDPHGLLGRLPHTARAHHVIGAVRGHGREDVARR